MKFLKSFEAAVPVIGGNKEYRMQNLPHKGEPIEPEGKISIFQQDWFEKLLPDTLTVVSYPKIYKLDNNQKLEDREKKDYIFEKNDCTICNNLVQFNYWNTPNYEPGEELQDGEPSCIEFDIGFTKNTDGIRILVEITYGDHMAHQFSIESPNKINLGHYTGIGSKYDSETHFGFSDESLKHILNFFNSFGHGICITAEDLKFLDEHFDNYEHDINNKDHYYTDDSDLLKFGNSMKDREPSLMKIKSFSDFNPSTISK